MSLNFINNPKTVGIIAAGFNGGQPKTGVELGPGMIIENGLVSQLQSLGWDVSLDDKIPLTYERLKPAASDPNLPIVQDKSLNSPPALKNVRYVSAVCKDVKENVEKTCKLGHVALTIGGDHSLALGTVSGSLAVYPNLGVLWVDAHADINTPETTSSGNLHGMPLSYLTGIASNSNFNEWLNCKLSLSRLVYIGLRDLDAGERMLLKKHNIRAYSMHEVDKYGIGKVVDMALDYLGKDKPIHLSFDVDALDPTVCPATGTPVRGGLTFREGHYICEEVYETGSLIALDIMEVNPQLGDSVAREQTVQIGCSLIRSALGETLL